MSTPRLTSAQRRQQIIDATLALLAEVPLDRVSTRQVAKRLGISQPAIYRHFRSVEAVALQAIAQLHQQIGAVLVAVLDAPTPGEQLEHIARQLHDFAQSQPALPRLLFGTIRGGPPAVQTALLRLLHQQRSVIAQIIEVGQSTGAITRTPDAETLSRDFLALLQGHLLQRLIWPDQPATTWAPRWLASVKGDGIPTTEPTTQAQGITALDVRPILAQGDDPLQTILRTLQAMAPGDVLQLTAPFHPKPLVTLLRSQGHQVHVQAHPPLFGLTIIHGAQPLHDLTELAAPEPLEQVLIASASLKPGEIYLARLPKYPALLIPHLESRGLRYQLHTLPSTQALLWMTR
jgi:AcrR family transcriptional regulator/uncharacterized protein (DUF2249 family)